MSLCSVGSVMCLGSATVLFTCGLARVSSPGVCGELKGGVLYIVSLCSDIILSVYARGLASMSM